MVDEHHCILRRHAEPGRAGYQYDVLHDGEVICTSRYPFGDACRALVVRGCSGSAFFWREGKDTYDFRFVDLRKGANTTVTEGDRLAPRIVRWQPFDASKFSKAA